MRRIVGATFILLCSLAACEPRRDAADAPQIIVFAAVSTTEALREAGDLFEQAVDFNVVFSFDSSSNLARQIKAGSPADIYVSADEHWMDDLATAGSIHPGTRSDLLANDLVMIAPAGGAGLEVEPSPEFDFAARLPQVRRVAVGDPAHVPAGRYARQALKSLGWWEFVEPLLVPSLDVRAALRLVEMGEADVGIVYATDAKQSEKVAVVARFPSGTHDPIHYPIAQCSDSAHAAQFIEFLRSPEVADIFERSGFRVLVQDGGG